MNVFDNAWSFLKALEEQQLHGPSTYSRGMAAMGAPPMIEGSRIKTMHPAIRGLMDRKLDYNTRNIGQSPKVTNTPQIQRENVEAWPKGYDPDADAELQAQEAYEQEQRQELQERERQERERLEQSKQLKVQQFLQRKTTESPEDDWAFEGG